MKIGVIQGTLSELEEVEIMAGLRDLTDLPNARKYGFAQVCGHGVNWMDYYHLITGGLSSQFVVWAS